MKLKDLKPVLYSLCGDVQFAIVYDWEENRDLENGCSVEYAIDKYGDRPVRRIGAEGGQLVISI
jgi:hypothetical protein